MLLLLYRVTSGREVASDVDVHAMLIDAPWAILLGTANADVASYAPLQSLVTWPLFTALSSMLPAFLAFRAMFVLVELAAFRVFLSIVERSRIDGVLRWLLPALFVVMPFQWLTSSVFVQDEIIAQLWLLLAVAALQRNRSDWALFALAAGVLTGKIFLIVPWFFVAVFVRPWGRAPWRAALASGALIVLVYAIAMAAALQRAGSLPLIDFVPGAHYSVTVWALLIDVVPEGSEALKRWSLLLSVAAQALLIGACLHGTRWGRSGMAPNWLLTAPLALFMASFYQHNAEYPTMFAPVLLLLWSNARAALLTCVVLCAAWAPKLFYGLKNIGLINANASETRNAILGDVVDTLGMNFQQLHTISVIVYSALYVWLVIAVLTGINGAAAGTSTEEHATCNATRET